MSGSVNSIRVSYEELRSIAAGDISGTYALIGTAFDHPVRQLIITNATDANIIISYDINNVDKSMIPATTARIVDYCSNTSMQGGIFEQPKGQGVYVKLESAAATTGNVYVEVIYGSIN